MRFNLSEWAIRHRILVTYFMLVVAVAGIGSYLRLGRSEDPDFTVKTMVVQAAWPGATVDDTLEQVTDRLERKLEETPDLDYLKSYTTPGQATIFVYLKDSTPPAQVPDIWYQVRKKVRDIRNTLPPGIIGPGFNDEFGDTYGIVYGFTADGFTHRQLRDYVDDVRKQLLDLPDISKIDVLGAIVSPAAAALERLDVGEPAFPEAQHVLRQIKLFCDLADGAESVGRLVQTGLSAHGPGASPSASSP